MTMRQAATSLPSREAIIDRLREQLENCQAIAAGTAGEARDGWLDDAAHYAGAISALTQQNAATQDQERPDEARTAGRPALGESINTPALAALVGDSLEVLDAIKRALAGQDCERIVELVNGYIDRATAAKIGKPTPPFAWYRVLKTGVVLVAGEKPPYGDIWFPLYRAPVRRPA